MVLLSRLMSDLNVETLVAINLVARRIRRITMPNDKLVVNSDGFVAKVNPKNTKNKVSNKKDISSWNEIRWVWNEPNFVFILKSLLMSV